MPVVLVGGPFGNADPGEEAQLAVFLRAFPDWHVVALSSDPAATSDRHGCESVDAEDPAALGRLFSSADAVVLLGDRVFNPHRATSTTTWAQRARNLAIGLSRSAAGRLVFLGAGLSSPPSGQTERSTLRSLIKRSSLLVLGDEKSASSLTRSGLPGPFRVGSDLIWMTVEPARHLPIPRPRSVHVVVSHHLGRDRALNLGHLLSSLRATDLDVELQPWQQDSGHLMDMSIAGSLSARLDGAEILKPAGTLEESVARMGEAEVVVSTNVHSLVAAALARAPAVAIGGDQQLEALAGRLGQDVIHADDPPARFIAALESAKAAHQDRIAREVTKAGDACRLLAMFLEGDRDTSDVPKLDLEPPPWVSEDPSVPDPDTTTTERPRSRLALPLRLGGLLVIAATLVTLVGASLLAATLRAPASEREAAAAAIERYFEGYLRDDGRVARAENGGDTASESQAYAMLLAVAAADRPTFDRVWNWTKENLRQDDGTLAWHWAGGEVLDAQSAPDADLDAAMALLLASERFGEPEYRADGLRLAKATLRSSTTKRGGRLYLTAGPWANGPPSYLNPSYLSFRVFADLAEDTSDPRWRQLEATGLEIIESLREPNTGLVPDWAELAEDGTMKPVPKPGTDQTHPAYGYDAVRTPIRLFQSCDPTHRDLSADMWTFLEQRLEEGSLPSVFALDGRPLDTTEHATSMIGAAAAAAAAGDAARSRELVEQASQAVGEADSYGAAWVALGRVILTTDLLGECPEPAQSQLAGS